MKMPKQKLGGCNMLTSHKNATSPQTMALDINQPTPHIEASVYYMTAALKPIQFYRYYVSVSEHLCGTC